MHKAISASLVAVGGFFVGCRPDLPKPEAGAGGAGAAGAIALRIEPATAQTAAPQVVRFHLEGQGVSAIDPADVWLFQGELGAYQLRDLKDGEIANTLAERALPMSVFRDGDALVAVPHTALEPGQAFAVGLSFVEQSFAVSVAERSPSPLSRVWPIARGAPNLLFCGDQPLPALDVQAALDPAGPRGHLRRGTPRGRAQHCVRFDAEDAVVGGPFHPPVEAAQGIALDPRPLSIEPGEPAPVDVVACEAGELAFGPGCAQVSDDRLIVRSPETEVVWVIAGPANLIHVQATAEGSRFVVRGLTPASHANLSVELLGPDGWSAHDVSIDTAPAQAHFVINEVLANPVGEEPAQEWVELTNDGSVPGLLDGLAIEDIGGHSLVPAGSGMLAPGAFALLVGDDYDPSSRYDVAPDASAIIVTIAAGLGKNGLANSGEPLRLVDANAAVLSRFPAEPKPKPGKSVARTRPDALDDDPDAFTLAEPPTPGVGNSQSAAAE